MSPSLENPADRNQPPTANVVRRRMEITIEREVVSVVYQPAAALTRRCEQCGKETLMLSADAAAAVQKVSSREIYRWLERNRLHFEESPDGTVLICSESLKRIPERDLP